MSDPAQTEPDTRARQLAADLLDIEAVLLRPDAPFTWSSGLQSPIYCDNRLTMAHPRVRRAIRDGFAALVEAHDLAADVVAGTATAGIPHAAWLSEKLDKPMAYIRSSAKGHGRENRIEGRIQPGDQVLVIEDLVSTGGSALDAVAAVRAAGAEVPAVLAIFSYGLDAATEAFAEANVPLHTLTDFPTLLEVAVEQGALSEDELSTLQAWRRDPEAWSATGSQ